MKNKRYLPIVLIILAILLNACSTYNTSNANTSSNDALIMEKQTETQIVERESKSTNELLIGTLMLDGTSEQITLEQAETLLPLWQLYQTLASEDETASEELDALEKQITSIFTEEQLTTMANFDYSNPMSIISDLEIEGLSFSENERSENIPEGVNPEGGSNNNSTMGGDGTRMRPSAGGNTGQAVDPDAMATAQAQRIGSERLNMQTQIFLRMLIEYLRIIAES